MGPRGLERGCGHFDHPDLSPTGDSSMARDTAIFHYPRDGLLVTGACLHGTRNS